MEKIGRNPEHLKILPGAFVVVGDSVDEAREKRAKLDSMVHYDSAIASLSVQLGTDASGFDPDGQLPRNFPKPTRARAAASGWSMSPRATSSRCASWPSASAATADCRSSARPERSPTRWRNG